MSKRETDLLQIKKYLNGELDAKAMHQLERRAQSDPFLMDALEGYESAGKNQQPQLDELAARLQQRVEKKERRIIPWNWLAIAASVLIVFTAGGLWFFNNKPANSIKIAAIVKPEIKPATPVIDSPAIPERENKAAAVNAPTLQQPRHNIKGPSHFNKAIIAKPAAAEQIANAATKEKATDTGSNDTPLDEMIVMDVTAKKKKNTTAGDVSKALQGRAAGVNVSTNSISGIVTSGKDGLPVVGALVRRANSPVETFTGPNGRFVLPVDSDKVKLNVSYLGYNSAQITVRTQDSVKIRLKPNTNILSEVAVTGYTAQRKKDITGAVANITNDKFLAPKTIKGKVVDKDDGMPLPGVTIKYKGTNIGTLTDANGRFTLPADSSKTTLAVAYIGYQTMEVNARKRDSVQTLAMVPAKSSLNEVVVTGYGSSKKSDEVTIIDAHPTNGWASLRKYLQENSKSPDGKVGVVKLSFTVSPNGLVSDIKVIKSLSPAADKKAIDLINNGPDWVGSSSGKDEVVKVRVKFVM